MSTSPVGPRQRNASLSQAAEGSNSLSPFKISNRDRSLSRPSSRTSLRSHSPSVSLDDPVAVRQQMSSLKHNIRQQQAQLNSLENIVRSGPRPYPSELSTSYSASAADDIYNPASYGVQMQNSTLSSAATNGLSSTPPSSFNSSTYINGNGNGNGADAAATAAAIKMKRRSSRDVLLSLAGPDSNLPIPKRDRDLTSPAGAAEDGLINGNAGIREGVPMTFSVASPTGYKRQASPTRTLSRIPVSSVGNARALQDEGTSSTPRPAPLDPNLSTPSTSGIPQPLPSPTPTTNGGGSVSSSASKQRYSLTPGGTTKVLADLQTGVVNARNALENTKGQLRMSQRTVATLTRQTEDLKEARERLRLENEGLNNVVARKERLLQEVLERARKAEAEAAGLKTQLKAETSTTKKAMREMEAALAESTALSAKSEREYVTLKESMRHLTEGWRHDAERLREEMRKREEGVGRMYKKLVEEAEKAKAGREEVKMLWEEERRKEEQVRIVWIQEIGRLKEGVEKEESKNEQATKIAQHLSEELARLRRLMQNAGRTASEDAP